MTKARAMYLLYGYPQASQTYIKTELEAVVADGYEVRIISTNQPEVSAPYRNHLPYEHVQDPGEMAERIQDFRPDVLHGHHLREIHVMAPLARKTNVPFTIRTHSFDILTSGQVPRPGVKGRLLSRFKGPEPGKIEKALEYVLDDLCLGLLAFPFSRPLMEAAGVPPEKIFDCFPVVNYDLFHDRSPNGDAIMNVGAALPKKNMEEFIDLGAKLPGMTFDLYPLAYKVDRLVEHNRRMGEPVNIKPFFEPEDMPAEYKRHQWLVYTASPRIGTVGWPMAVAEAQAAGVGVCLQRVRPDLSTYVGDAGILFDTVDELLSVITEPVPDDMRERGFEQARRSDVKQHLRTLTDLWDSVSIRAA